MKETMDIIEEANNYYLLSNDKMKHRPNYVGRRAKLAYVLQDVPKDMIIATSGNFDRCIILVDYTTAEVKALINRDKN